MDRTAFDKNTRRYLCQLSGEITHLIEDEKGKQVIAFLYPDNYVFFGGNMMTGWYLAEDLETLMPEQPIELSMDKSQIMADGLDEMVVSGLPIPCKVWHDGVVYSVDDGTFEFSADQPGKYIFTIDEIEYAATEFYINAN